VTSAACTSVSWPTLRATSVSGWPRARSLFANAARSAASPLASPSFVTIPATGSGRLPEVFGQAERGGQRGRSFFVPPPGPVVTPVSQCSTVPFQTMRAGGAGFQVSRAASASAATVFLAPSQGRLPVRPVAMPGAVCTAPAPDRGLAGLGAGEVMR
jgi:hypothetical protein